MPNWCGNSLVVRGTKDKIAKLHRDLAEPAYMIGDHGWLPRVSYAPPPWGGEPDIDPYHSAVARTLGHLAQFNIDRGAMIRSAVGCKWDFNLELNMEGEEELTFCSFTTAWSPPEHWAKRLALKYGVDLTLNFDEAGADFGGIVEINSECDKVFAYSSNYREWVYTDVSGDLEEFMERICMDPGEEWEDLVADTERGGWPTSWEGYKHRYLDSTYSLADAVALLDRCFF